LIRGFVVPGFEPVLEAFTAAGEGGYAAIVDGEVVADLRCGLAEDSLVQVYSVTKPVAAVCVLMLVDRGLLELDDRVRQVLSHQAGVPGLREPQPTEVLYDWDRMCELIAAEEPWFEPGTAHAEHALTYGYLCGEIVRRVDGRSLGRFWREEVAEPRRLDFHIGLRPEELARTVDLTGELPEFGHQAIANPPGARDLSVVNSTAWRTAEIPAVNGHGTAMALARFFAELDQLLSPETLRAMVAGEMTAHDPVVGDEMTWGLGVWVEPDGYGMGGIGGSFAMADPELGLAEAYVTPVMGSHDRADSVDAALREVLSRARPSAAG
jgi:CubicO group peptidase (beta-lactamase class C family)